LPWCGRWAGDLVGAHALTIVNKKELAELLGKSERTLTDWQKKDNPLPIWIDGVRGSTNQYDTVEVINWLIARDVSKAFGDGPNVDGEFLDSDQQLARLRKAQADKVEIEVALLEGRVLDAEDVQLAFGKIDSEVKSAFLSMPSRMAPVLIKIRSVKEMTRAIKEDVLQTLGKLSSVDDGDIDLGSPPGET